MTNSTVRKLAVELVIELQQLTLGPDDVLVLRSEQQLKRELFEEMSQMIGSLDLPARRVLWVDPDVTISVTTPAEADRLIAAAPETR